MFLLPVWRLRTSSGHIWWENATVYLIKYEGWRMSFFLNAWIAAIGPRKKGKGKNGANPSIPLHGSLLDFLCLACRPPARQKRQKETLSSSSAAIRRRLDEWQTGRRARRAKILGEITLQVSQAKRKNSKSHRMDNMTQKDYLGSTPTFFPIADFYTCTYTDEMFQVQCQYPHYCGEKLSIPTFSLIKYFKTHISMDEELQHPHFSRWMEMSDESFQHTHFSLIKISRFQHRYLCRWKV